MVHIISSHGSYKAEYKYNKDACQQDRPKGVTSDEEEETLVNNIINSPAPIPICLCPIDFVPYSPTPSLQHDLHLIDALEHGEAMSAPLQEYPQQY